MHYHLDGFALLNHRDASDDGFMTKTSTTPEADQRMVAFLLARTVRALRRERLERASTFLQAASLLLEHMPEPEACRGIQLVESLAGLGFDRQTELEVARLGRRYYYLKVPFSTQPTKWHPTTAVGPFAVLTRGAFATPEEAHQWAQRELAGQPYDVESEEA